MVVMGGRVVGEFWGGGEREKEILRCSRWIWFRIISSYLHR